MTETGGEHCLGCGDSLPKGSYRRLFSSCSIVSLWKNLIREILEDQGLELGQIGRRYVCRKCLRSYEGYVASKSKVLAGLNKAIEFLPVSTVPPTMSNLSLGKRKLFFSEVSSCSKRPRIRAASEAQSPSIQVFTLCNLI